MKNYQNQLDRFGNIAKKLVDDHSADFFNRCRMVQEEHLVKNEAFYNHLDALGRQLEEQAQRFIVSAKKGSEDLKSDVWNLCKKYLDLFIKTNQPAI